MLLRVQRSAENLIGLLEACRKNDQAKLPNKKGSFASPACFPLLLERETSLELATSTLARLRSTN
jgi:hypothetical protein